MAKRGHRNASLLVKKPPARVQSSTRPAPGRIKVFESYSHHAEKQRIELIEKHLAGLKRSIGLLTWHDAKIVPGSEIDRAITQQLETADLILLRVTANFVDSEYCYCKEMRTAMERHERGQAIVIPIILRPVDWHDTPFAKLLALPQNGSRLLFGRPVMSLIWTS